MTEHSEDCEFFAGTLVKCKCPQPPYNPLGRAIELIEGMDERHQARTSSGNLGEPMGWQTEVNEIRRILHYLRDALRAPKPG